MLDIGWPELMVVAIVLIVVVGPKDLPKMLRTFGKTTSKMRSMASDFRRQFDDALKEAELDEVKSVMDSARKLDPTAEVRKQLNPLNKIGDDIKSGLSDATKPSNSDTSKTHNPKPAVATSNSETGKAASEPAKTAAESARKPAAKSASKPVAKPKSPAAKKKTTVKKTTSKKAVAGKAS